MARNSSGTHSLPAGNPVVTGTPISSTTHNNTMTDVSSELTDSLSRSGKGPMLAPLKIVDGSDAAPGLAFEEEPSTGLARPQEGIIEIVLEGTPVIAIGGGGGGGGEIGILHANGDTDRPAGVRGIGNGSGSGVAGTGGATGDGVSGTAGGGNANGVDGTGSGSGAGVIGRSHTSGAGAALRGAASTDCIPCNLQQTGTARGHISFTLLASAPTAPVLGEVYVDTSAIMWICTNATGPVWTKVGTQT